jgi:hypothetical protein
MMLMTNALDVQPLIEPMTPAFTVQFPGRVLGKSGIAAIFLAKATCVIAGFLPLTSKASCIMRDQKNARQKKVDYWTQQVGMEVEVTLASDLEESLFVIIVYRVESRENRRSYDVPA